MEPLFSLLHILNSPLLADIKDSILFWTLQIPCNNKVVTENEVEMCVVLQLLSRANSLCSDS